jgi:hypothetical protein
MRGGGGGLLFVEAPPTPMSGLGPRLLAVAWDPHHNSSVNPRHSQFV